MQNNCVQLNLNERKEVVWLCGPVLGILPLVDLYFFLHWPLKINPSKPAKLAQSTELCQLRFNPFDAEIFIQGGINIMCIIYVSVN